MEIVFENEESTNEERFEITVDKENFEVSTQSSQLPINPRMVGIEAIGKRVSIASVP